MKLDSWPPASVQRHLIALTSSSSPVQSTAQHPFQSILIQSRPSSPMWSGPVRPFVDSSVGRWMSSHSCCCGRWRPCEWYCFGHTGGYEHALTNGAGRPMGDPGTCTKGLSLLTPNGKGPKGPSSEWPMDKCDQWGQNAEKVHLGRTIAIWIHHTRILCLGQCRHRAHVAAPSPPPKKTKKKVDWVKCAHPQVYPGRYESKSAPRFALCQWRWGWRRYKFFRGHGLCGSRGVRGHKGDCAARGRGTNIQTIIQTQMQSKSLIWLQTKQPTKFQTEVQTKMRTNMLVAQQTQMQTKMQIDIETKNQTKMQTWLQTEMQTRIQTLLNTKLANLGGISETKMDVALWVLQNRAFIMPLSTMHNLLCHMCWELVECIVSPYC